MSTDHAPLSGIRVVDLTSMIVGPVCTVRLAEYGADVIKVEAPEGDLMRTLGGPSPSGKNSGSFIHCNKGKRLICLDLKSAPGRQALTAILASADVFVSNMRPAALERLGLDANSLRKEHSRLIHCTISGFGPGGPYRGLPAYDTVLQGASGLAGLFDRRDGTPIYVPMMICDHVVGEIAAGAIMSALVSRSTTGDGAALEVPMFETMAAFVLQEHLGPHTFNPPIGPVGDSRILSPANAPLQTLDGWISVTTNTDAQTHAFLKAAGRDDLVSDPRFTTTSARFKNADVWFEWRRSSLHSKTTAEWLKILNEADVPAMPCHSLDSLLDDPHLREVELFQSSDHPSDGRLTGLRSTIIWNEVFSQAAGAPGLLGQHTREVLSQVGMSHDEIDAVIAARAGFEADPSLTRRVEVVR